MMFSKLVKIVGVVLLLGLVFVPQPGNAAILTLSSGVNTVTLNDLGTGFVSYNGAVGGWIINVTTAIAQPPFPGGFSLQDVDLNSVNMSTDSTPLTITFLTDPLLAPSSPFVLDRAYA